jgi:hypothetical protein
MKRDGLKGGTLDVESRQCVLSVPKCRRTRILKPLRRKVNGGKSKESRGGRPSIIATSNLGSMNGMLIAS